MPHAINADYCKVPHQLKFWRLPASLLNNLASLIYSFVDYLIIFVKLMISLFNFLIIIFNQF